MCVYLACTHIKDLFIGLWRGVLSQHLNCHRYFHIFPIRSPHTLKQMIKTIQDVKLKYLNDNKCCRTVKELAHTPCKQYQRPLHPEP